MSRDATLQETREAAIQFKTLGPSVGQLTVLATSSLPPQHPRLTIRYLFAPSGGTVFSPDTETPQERDPRND